MAIGFGKWRWFFKSIFFRCAHPRDTIMNRYNSQAFNCLWKCVWFFDEPNQNASFVRPSIWCNRAHSNTKTQPATFSIAWTLSLSLSFSRFMFIWLERNYFRLVNDCYSANNCSTANFPIVTMFMFFFLLFFSNLFLSLLELDSCRAKLFIYMSTGKCFRWFSGMRIILDNNKNYTRKTTDETQYWFNAWGKRTTSNELSEWNFLSKNT